MKDVDAINEVCEELLRAEANYPAMASFHEGYAVILEELEELWDEIKQKPTARNKDLMRAEAVQVAAMAVRFIVDLT